MGEIQDEDIMLAKIFRFLALSMHYPEETWFNKEYLADLGSLLEQLGRPEDIQNLNVFLSESPDDIEELQVEHTRLFINGVPHVIAPPYGSVYIEGEGTIMNISTEEVLAYYRKWGFELAKENDIADHLVCELAFLALLAESGESDAMALFFQKLFWPWFGTFRDRVIEGAELPFYKIVVRLIDFFTREEEVIMEEKTST